jgi:hypothetical protein
MDVDMVFGFASHFNWVLKNSPCKIIADCDARHHGAALDVLPLLGLTMTAPRLHLAFRADAFGCMDGLDDSETNDLSRLVELSRTQGQWQRHLLEFIFQTLGVAMEDSSQALPAKPDFTFYSKKNVGNCGWRVHTTLRIY